jgi:membrane-associated protease RseP (regulator of RpoE activity)
MLEKLLYFIVLIGVLIFVHEMGHFLFAKLFKVKVLKFSLGFGPRVFGFRRGETDYCVSAIPFGGYVKMLGEDPTEELDPRDHGRAFTDKKLYQRFLIVFGGPLFNLVFPILIYFIYFASQSTLLPSSIGTVIAGRPAWEAGLRPGDRIVGIDGARVRYWEDVLETISASPGRELRLSIEREGKLIPELRVTPDTVTVPNKLMYGETVGQIGVAADALGTRVGVSDPSSPAARAGLRTWDEIVAIDGKKVRRWSDVESALYSRPERTAAAHKLTILRPEDSGAKFITASLLRPLEVSLEPARAGGAAASLLYGMARGLGAASRSLERVLERRPSQSPAERATDATRRAVAAAGLDRGAALAKEHVPGWRAVAEAAGAAERDASPRRGGFLRGLAASVASAAIDLPARARQGLAWPVVHEVRRAVNRFAFHGLEPSEFFVNEVRPSSPAEAIGLRPGARVVSFDGRGLTLWSEIRQALRQTPDADFEIGFVQDGVLEERRFRQQKKVIVDEYKNEIEQYVFGALPLAASVLDDKVANEARFSRAIRNAFKETVKVITMTAVGIARLVEGKISFKSVGGPVMIFDVAGKAARKGWETFLEIMALISINLGLLNLLPIPVLDGGHLVFIGIEAIKRKPISLRAREIAGLVGFSLLILLMLFALKNDIERYWKDIVDVFR